jgi:hypothetical protein
MADVAINNLSPIIPSTGLFLPASDSSTTGRVTIANINSLAPVQSVFGRTSDVTLQYADYLAGALIQVNQAAKTDTWTVDAPANYQAWTDIPGLSVTTVPKRSNSKMLIDVSLAMTGDTRTQGYCRILRNNTTPIGVGGVNGSRPQACFNSYTNQENEIKTSGFKFLDNWNSPDTVTYKLQVLGQGGDTSSGTIYVNRSVSWSNSSASCTACSTLIVSEIAG